jgi:hypothetical protein
MVNIFSQEYIYKFGRLIQYGISYMQGHSTFADLFISEFQNVKSELDTYGYSLDWIQWQKQNAQNIIDLHDSLSALGLIPTSPIN